MLSKLFFEKVLSVSSNHQKALKITALRLSTGHLNEKKAENLLEVETNINPLPRMSITLMEQTVRRGHKFLLLLKQKPQGAFAKVLQLLVNLRRPNQGRVLWLFTTVMHLYTQISSNGVKDPRRETQSAAQAKIGSPSLLPRREVLANLVLLKGALHVVGERLSTPPKVGRTLTPLSNRASPSAGLNRFRRNCFANAKIVR